MKRERSGAAPSSPSSSKRSALGDNPLAFLEAPSAAPEQPGDGSRNPAGSDDAPPKSPRPAKGTPKRAAELGERIFPRVTRDLALLLRLRARCEGRSVTDICTEALERHMAGWKPPPELMSLLRAAAEE